MTPIENNNSIVNKPILTANGTRIFRPHEMSLLLRNIPKDEYCTMFEFLLYTGCRYIEAKRIKENPNWFDGYHIHLPKKAVLKRKIRMRERYIHLNPIGRRVVREFLHGNKTLPSYNVWQENLRRWCEMAGLKGDNVSAKSTRKTWECWLVTYYPHLTNHIFLSQGHSVMTALNHYVNLPFDEDDIRDMKEFVEGWK